jgi:hypothetical protein
MHREEIAKNIPPKVEIKARFSKNFSHGSKYASFEALS